MTSALIPDPQVEDVFERYADPARETLLRLRALILETAASTDGVGPLTETLKWGQPSYLPARSGIGTTVRIDKAKGTEDTCALYFHCQTSLVETFRDLYPDAFVFEGNRALLVKADAPLPETEIRHCVALALTYHRRKKDKAA